RSLRRMASRVWLDPSRRRLHRGRWRRPRRQQGRRLPPIATIAGPAAKKGQHYPRRREIADPEQSRVIGRRNMRDGGTKQGITYREGQEKGKTPDHVRIHKRRCYETVTGVCDQVATTASSSIPTG